MHTNTPIRAQALRVALTALLGLGLVGCNYGKRNVAACEDWVVNMDVAFEGTGCEGTDFAGLLQGGCQLFEESKCDISAYFECLEENTECNEVDEINTEGWNDCVALSTCE